MTEPVTLYTFSLSHFSEKIRWTLGLEGIPFVEVPWTPGFHVGAARRSGGATTVPVLASGAERVQDSTRILHWLEANRGPLRLLPRDATTRAEALEIEDRFDGVGERVIRLAYHHVLPDTAGVVRLWGIDAGPMERVALRAAFPIFRTVFRRRLNLTEARVASARERVESALAFVEERAARGRYLVGDALSIADVTAAALLAPLVCPDEHPVYASAPYRAGVAGLVAPWRDRAAFEWVRSMYREHRGDWPRAATVRAALA